MILDLDVTWQLIFILSFALYTFYCSFHATLKGNVVIELKIANQKFAVWPCRQFYVFVSSQICHSFLSFPCKIIMLAVLKFPNIWWPRKSRTLVHRENWYNYSIPFSVSWVRKFWLNEWICTTMSSWTSTCNIKLFIFNSYLNTIFTTYLRFRSASSSHTRGIWVLSWENMSTGLCELCINCTVLSCKCFSPDQ